MMRLASRLQVPDISIEKRSVLVRVGVFENPSRRLDHSCLPDILRNGMTDANDQEDIAVKSYVFKVVVEEDAFEDGRKAYHAHCRGLKGCHTWGHTYEEALTNIREAVELYVEDLLEAGKPIPVDSEQGVVEMPSPSVVVNL